MSTSAILPAAAASSSSTPAPGASSAQGLNTMFMQLLMAQLKNQSPLSPMDPTQFVGQLAQFSELSAVNSIYTLLQQMVPGGSGSVPTKAISPANGGLNSGTGTVPQSSSPLPAAPGSGSFLSPVSPASAIIPDFASPTLNSLTSKIQGGFPDAELFYSTFGAYCRIHCAIDHRQQSGQPEHDWLQG